MSVAAVVREAGVSRQWLDRQFRARLGATPSELIRQRRLAAARVMLLETHLPVETVARRAGFSSGENLARVFRAATGVTPREFRMREGFAENRQACIPRAATQISRR
jgi:AraC-like DNA-binding protein